MIKPFSKQNILFTFIIDKTSRTAMGSTGFPKISFKTVKSSLNIVVTSPSLYTELKRPARPAICSACDVEIVSSSFSPFSFTLGFTRELKMILLILLKEVQNHYFLLVKKFEKKKKIRLLVWRYSQVQTHSNCIRGNKDFARVIWIIKLFGLSQLGACWPIKILA